MWVFLLSTLFPLAQSVYAIDFNIVSLFSPIRLPPTPVFAKALLLSASCLPGTSISPAEKCDFLNLTFLLLPLPECNSVMRYSIETNNRLMVHLAWLINSCVEVEKASSSIREVVFPSSRPQITFGT